MKYNTIKLIMLMNTNINKDNKINNRKNILNEKAKANLEKRLKPHVHLPPITTFPF